MLKAGMSISLDLDIFLKIHILQYCSMITFLSICLINKEYLDLFSWRHLLMNPSLEFKRFGSSRELIIKSFSAKHNLQYLVLLWIAFRTVGFIPLSFNSQMYFDNSLFLCTFDVSFSFVCFLNLFFEMCCRRSNIGFCSGNFCHWLLLLHIWWRVLDIDLTKAVACGFRVHDLFVVAKYDSSDNRHPWVRRDSLALTFINRKAFLVFSCNHFWQNNNTSSG